MARGEIGRVHTVYGHAVGWMTHMFTHMVDLMGWYNGSSEADWVMGQAAGASKMGDIHPSPDYVAGVVQYKNGVRGYVECGAGAPDVPEVAAWWRKNRVGAMGTEGFAEALTGGGWRAVTKSGAASGGGSMNYDLDMPPYVDQMADWLDDDAKVHPCNGENAYQGFEIMMGLLRSVVGRGQIALPLGPGEPELELLKRVLPDRPVLALGRGEPPGISQVELGRPASGPDRSRSRSRSRTRSRSRFSDRAKCNRPRGHSFRPRQEAETRGQCWFGQRFQVAGTKHGSRNGNESGQKPIWTPPGCQGYLPG